MIDFLFQDISARPVILLRLCLGVVLLAKYLLLLRERNEWYHDVLVSDRVSKAATLTFNITGLTAASSMVIGFMPQIGAAICLASSILFHRINSNVSFGADFVQNLFLLPLVFIPDSAMLPRIAMLFLQVQLAILYWKCAIAKLQGEAWRNGNALYYVLSLPNFTRFELSAHALRRLRSKSLTWSVISIELLVPVMLFVPPLRLPGIALLLLLHLSIELLMNLHLFEWTMIACLTIFLFS